MQKKIIFSSLLIVIMMTFVLNLNAATVSMYATKSNMNIGETSTVIVDGGGVAGNITISSSNPSVVSIVSVSSNWIENNKITVTVKANAVGSSSILANGKVANLSNSEDESDVNKSVSITVKEKEVINNNNNNNNNSNNNNQSNNTVASNTKNNNSNANNTKSSNNYLKSLQVSEEGLTPDFNRNKLNYSLSVGEKVTSINVTAVPEDSKAKVYVSGNTELKDGDNNVLITVTAQNGSKRTYTIVVNKSADPEKANSYLSNLIIKDMILTPEFSNEVLEYDGGTVRLSGDKLEIYAYPTNENAKVEIIGNENLVDGENTVTIKVTSEDGTSTKEYVIKFIKETGEETQALEDEGANSENVTKNWLKDIFKDLWRKAKANSLMLLMYLFIIVEFVQIIYLYKVVKKKDEELAKMNNTVKSIDGEKLSENNELLLEESETEKEELLSGIGNENLLDQEKKDEINNDIDFSEEELHEEKSDETQEEISKMVKSIWDEDDKKRFDESSRESRNRNGNK